MSKLNTSQRDCNYKTVVPIIRLIKAILVIKFYRNWPTALLDRLHLLPKGPVIYKLRNDVVFLMTAKTFDVQVINEIWIDRIYSPGPGWEIGSSWLVVDLGANRGVFSIFAGQEARKVLAVEANPEAHAVCLANLSINGLLEKVELLQGAIAASDGVAEFYIGSDAVNSSLVPRDNIAVERKVKVAKISISRLLDKFERVDLLKVDIEGGEYGLILSPRSESWLQKVRRIAMEYHDVPEVEHTIDNLITHLKSVGFDILLREKRRMLYAERVS